MGQVLVDVAVALATGVGLWLLLPRGVVLTKAPMTHNLGGDPVYDTWRIQNDSALPVRITSAAYRGPDTFNDRSWAWVELTEAVDERRGVSLHLDDEVPEIRRLDKPTPWSEVEVQPGDTLTAKVPNLTDLRISYRRAGPFGFVERRDVTLSGGA